MIFEEYNEELYIDKLNKDGLFIEQKTNWYPLEKEKEREKIFQTQQWIRKNFKKTEEINHLLSSDILFKLFLNENKNITKGHFIYRFFVESFLFRKQNNKIYFNLEWKNDIFNKIQKNIKLI